MYIIMWNWESGTTIKKINNAINNRKNWITDYNMILFERIFDITVQMYEQFVQHSGPLHRQTNGMWLRQTLVPQIQVDDK